MPNVTAQELQGIIEVPTELDLAPFIATASLIVTEDLANQGLSAARLKQIELYLAAHFAAIKDEHGALKSSETLNAKETYGGSFTKGLNLTRYGQQAIVFDTSGILANMAEPTKRAEFRVV